MIDYDGKNLIFVISQPRSGSTLLQRLLAGTPEVHTVAEPWMLLPITYLWKFAGHTADYDANLCHLAIQDFCKALPHGSADLKDHAKRMVVDLYNLTMPAGKTVFLDKTPRYYLIVDQLRELFPQAKFVFLVRNPLGVIASVLDSWVKDDVANLDHYKADLNIAPVKIADALNGHLGLYVSYESLVVNPEAVLDCLCADLGITFSPSMIQYGNNPKPSGEFGDNIGIPLHNAPVTESVNKWRQTLATPANWAIAKRIIDDMDPDVCRTLRFTKTYLLENLESIRP